MLKRLHHTGSTLRSRSVADKGAIRAAVEDNALPLIAAGKVKPVIYKTFPLAEAAAAHALMETQRPYRQDRANPLKTLPLSCPRERSRYSWQARKASGREIGALSKQNRAGGICLQIFTAGGAGSAA